ncbi:hypothetical protein T05_4613 [Trichinella murrelli]|uniref:Uncharacterized protein n=1 Tax=Trichinella murrelli TaxID=144512 RepID=A0A0V0SVU5_9BILA|nr:hypothetical protein T05_4613 [Trichinella murrelli]
MPQVRQAASSLMLVPVANTSMCLDALCHNKKIITGLRCSKRDRDLQVPTMIGQFWESLCSVALLRHKWPGWVLFLPRCALSKPPSFPFCTPSVHPPGSFRCDHSA